MRVDSDLNNDAAPAETAVRGSIAPEDGEPCSAADLMPLVYDALRCLARDRIHRERPGQTLQATSLVHEAYLRLVAAGPAQEFRGRGHFYAAAAQAMRRILVERARERGRLKRGGGGAAGEGGARQRVGLDDAQLTLAEPPEDIVALDEALSLLAEQQPDKARLVELRYFAGMTMEEAALTLGVSVATAKRHWAYARAWLYRHIAADRSRCAGAADPSAATPAWGRCG